MPTTSAGPVPAKSNTHINRLVRRNLDPDSEAEEDTRGDKSDTSKSWLEEYNRYMNTHEVVASEMSIVAWWGVSLTTYFVSALTLMCNHLQINTACYPTWASLARDYLAIMASSVSSERAFSSAGITISKHRNRLKKDIVEAIQCTSYG